MLDKQDPAKKGKKKRYRLVDDPIPTDPAEFEAYQRGEYEEEPFLDYFNRSGHREAIEAALKAEEEKRQKASLAKAQNIRMNSPVVKMPADATKTRK